MDSGKTVSYTHLDVDKRQPTSLDINGGKPSVMGVHLVSEAERLAYACLLYTSRCV